MPKTGLVTVMSARAESQNTSAASKQAGIVRKRQTCGGNGEVLPLPPDGTLSAGMAMREEKMEGWMGQELSRLNPPYAVAGKESTKIWRVAVRTLGGIGRWLC